MNNALAGYHDQGLGDTFSHPNLRHSSY